MKMNKLLFFLLALISLNSCVEYVDNGVKPENGQTPEEQKFTAEQSNPTTAKYVSDTFEFKAMLNNVDVTKSTKFKVNGVLQPGNSYIPHKEGSHSVIATMDDKEASFKFTVLPKDEEPEPEPKGNRIEYDGKSYPVTKTQWGLIVDGNALFIQKIGGVDHALWYMTSSGFDSANKVIHEFGTIIAMPVNSKGQAILPFADSSMIIHVGGYLALDGNEVFEESSNVVYTFAATGNTQPNDQNIGTANYTGVMTDKKTNGTAELFWNGDYMFFTPDIADFSKAKSSKKNVDIKKIRSVKGLNLNKVASSKLFANK